MLSYLPGQLRMTDGTMLETFQNLNIDTKGITFMGVPGTIEAEHFAVNVGWERESCSDTGGGFDMGYTDDGDYLDYQVSVTETGRYRISYRLASGNDAGGKLDLVLFSSPDEPIRLHTVTVPNTGGWQNWVTITRELDLTAGDYRLRILVSQREFNLNWFRLDLTGTTGATDVGQPVQSLKLYPNPATSQLFIELNNIPVDEGHLRVIDLQGQVVKAEVWEGQSRAMLNVSALRAGVYVLQLISNQLISHARFVVAE